MAELIETMAPERMCKNDDQVEHRRKRWVGHRLRIYFWTIDPGYFNLKLAIKTVVVILVALWCVRDEATLIKVMTGLAGGASMQGINAQSFLARLGQIIIFDALYFIALLLGFFARSSPHWGPLVLVSLGFGVNYIRRFGLEKNMAPMVIWVMCFLATILPVSSRSQLWPVVDGIFIGFLVSACMTLFIFPDQYPQLFVKNANRFFHELAEGLVGMRRFVLLPPTGSFEQLPFVLIKTHLEHLLASNQAIQDSSSYERRHPQMNRLLIKQYALFSAYSLMVDVYHALWLKHHVFPPRVILILSQMHKTFILLFSSMKVDSDELVSGMSFDSSRYNFAQKLGRIELQDAHLIMALLNFKLGFDLFKKHSYELLKTGGNGASKHD